MIEEREWRARERECVCVCVCACVCTLTYSDSKSLSAGWLYIGSPALLRFFIFSRAALPAPLDGLPPCCPFGGHVRTQTAVSVGSLGTSIHSLLLPCTQQSTILTGMLLGNIVPLCFSMFHVWTGHACHCQWCLQTFTEAGARTCTHAAVDVGGKTARTAQRDQDQGVCQASAPASLTCGPTASGCEWRSSCTTSCLVNATRSNWMKLVLTGEVEMKHVSP